MVWWCNGSSSSSCARAVATSRGFKFDWRAARRENWASHSRLLASAQCKSSKTTTSASVDTACESASRKRLRPSADTGSGGSRLRSISGTSRINSRFQTNSSLFSRSRLLASFSDNRIASATAENGLCCETCEKRTVKLELNEPANSSASRDFPTPGSPTINNSGAWLA